MKAKQKRGLGFTFTVCQPMFASSEFSPELETGLGEIHQKFAVQKRLPPLQNVSSELLLQHFIHL